MYNVDVGATVPSHCQIEAWRPSVPGIAEVFHAHIVDYAYPLHCHDTWTVLIVDDGAITYELDTRRCGASGQTVAILPPGVVHDGRPASRAPGGFWKRNLYLDPGFLPIDLVGAAVDNTNLRDAQLRGALADLHDSLVNGEEPLDGESRLAMIAERISAHLTPRGPRYRSPEPLAAYRLRELLDAHIVESITLKLASRTLGWSVPHMIRSFTRTFGVSPYGYVIGRRIDAARGMLLAGAAPAQVALAVGFFDQAHFTRHFKRHTSASPARYAGSHASRR